MNVGNVFVLLLVFFSGVLTVKIFMPDEQSVPDTQALLDVPVTPSEKLISKKNIQQFSAEVFGHECDSEFSVSKCAALAFPKDVMSIFDDADKRKASNEKVELEFKNRVGKTITVKRRQVSGSSASTNKVSINRVSTNKVRTLTPKAD